MSKYEIERIDARRVLLDRLLEIDQISDEEIEEHQEEGENTRFTLLRLSKMSSAERGFSLEMKQPISAADADKFLYDKNGIPK